MELQRGIFPRLLLGTIAIAILAFVVRGFTQLALGVETARLLSLPLFLVGLALAVVSFVLSILFKLGVLSETDASPDS